MREIESKGELLASVARQKSEAIIGVKSYRGWESFASRLRAKLNLKSETNEDNMNPLWKKQ